MTGFERVKAEICFRCDEKIGLGEPFTMIDDGPLGERFLHERCAEEVADEKWHTMQLEAEQEAFNHEE